MTPDVPRLRAAIDDLLKAHDRYLAEWKQTVFWGSDAPPDGAAEREKLSTENLLDRIYHFEMWARDSWKDEGIASVLHDAAAKIAALSNPTPAPTEAPAADADLPDDLASCAWIEACENDPELDEHDLDQRQAFLAGWSSGEEHGIALNPASLNATLAARPAAVTDEMVEAAASAYFGVDNWKSFPAPTVTSYREAWRSALTAALAARGPA